MNRLNELNKSPEVLRALFILRLAKKSQVVSFLSDRHPNDIKEKNMYQRVGRYIETLTKNALIYIAHKGKGRETYYSLTELGLEEVKKYLEIPYEKGGIGYCEDYGDLEYGLYSPPKKNIAHQLMLVDTLCILNAYRKKVPEAELDYRDNLYSAKIFITKDEIIRQIENSRYTQKEVVEKKRRFRPDGSFMIKDREYTIEVDAKTESIKALTAKIQSYVDYYEFLAKDNWTEKIHYGVMFIVDKCTHMTFRRWCVLAKVYLDVALTSNYKFRLLLTDFDSLTQKLDSELETIVARYKYFAKEILSFVKFNLEYSERCFEKIVTYRYEIHDALAFPMPLNRFKVGDDYYGALYLMYESYSFDELLILVTANDEMDVFNSSPVNDNKLISGYVPIICIKGDNHQNKQFRALVTIIEDLAREKNNNIYSPLILLFGDHGLVWLPSDYSNKLNKPFDYMAEMINRHNQR